MSQLQRSEKLQDKRQFQRKEQNKTELLKGISGENYYIECPSEFLTRNVPSLRREKQLQKQREMSSKLEMFERIQDENLMINLELNALKLEKENMIHLMVCSPCCSTKSII